MAKHGNVRSLSPELSQLCNLCPNGSPQSPGLRHVQIYYGFGAAPIAIDAQLFLSNGGNNGLSGNSLGQHLSLISVMALQ